MGCFYPLIGYQIPGQQVVFKPPAKTRMEDYRLLKVPCGQCIGCRLEKSRKWAMRCVYEASLHEENSFLTLTYAPEHLPENGTLLKRDLTLFLKRLRKAYSGKCIRYFGCGEYGDKFARPHYHLILFGFSPPELRRELCPQTLPPSLSSFFFSSQSAVFGSDLLCSSSGCSDESNLTVTFSKSLAEIWQKGHVAVGSVTFNSCAYVARYCCKKVTGDKAKAHYDGRIPEYVVMSRRPGIAGNWIKKYLGDVYPADKCLIRGVRCKPPRFFDNVLAEINRCLFDVIKKDRKIYSELHEKDQLELERLEEFQKQKNKFFSRKYEKGLDI